MNEAPQVYEWTGPTGVKFRDIRQPSGTYYHHTTPKPVIDALENVMHTHRRVRLFYGDRDSGRGWLEENDCAGIVGRSMGPIKVPILLANERSTGGGAILCDCIVRMLVDGREVYRHPKYQAPSIQIKPDNKHPELKWAACVNSDEVHARFKSEASARRWAAFMLGQRMTK